MPRQMQRSGTRRSSAQRAAVASKRVAQGSDVGERGMRRLAEERGIDVAAAGEEEAVEAGGEALPGAAGELRRQRHAARRPPAAPRMR